MSREELDAKIAGILEFADIGEFIHQPVRTYSSGMSIRLAFAILTAVDPEILIVDEALSVGDAFFQSKCVRWLEDFLARGRTFVCVSHDMFLLQRVCRRGIVLKEGRVVCDGPIAEAVNVYYKLHTARGNESSSSEGLPQTAAQQQGYYPLNLSNKHRTGTREVTIDKVFTNLDLSTCVEAGDWLEVEIHLTCQEPVAEFDIGLGFRDRSGQLIGGFHTLYTEHKLGMSVAGSSAVLRFRCKLDLRPQVYLLLIGVAWNSNYNEWHDYDCLWDCASLTLIGKETFWGFGAATWRIFGLDRNRCRLGLKPLALRPGMLCC
ncbi:MAG: Wzt carbohydrate-binding domain-containing protein [Verrucomicrobia bacterium]|nr:Wzt carbohydrate-binding domain-containing protein [Verrucomicrobiota bacterium]